MCVSGSFDGTLCHWLVGQEGPQAVVAAAHDASVWALAHHPMGHVLASGARARASAVHPAVACTHALTHTHTHTQNTAAGGDACIKFWCRARPGDPWEDAHLKDQQDGATSYAGGGEPR